MLGKKWLRAGILIAAAAGMANAHLSMDGLKPAAGEVLKIGSTYAVTWKEVNNHAKGSNIDLSVDGGKTWSTIKKDYADNLGTNTFNWTVAGAATTTAKLRICQHEGTPVTACRDVDNVNALTADINGNYFMITGAFTIAATTGIRSVSGASGFSVDFRPETRNVDVAFGLADNRPVLLQAFDTQGRLLATLIQGDFAAGEHKLSLFSGLLNGSGGSLIFKLKVGDQVQSHTWTSAR
jgi:hypothetical protein